MYVLVLRTYVYLNTYTDLYIYLHSRVYVLVFSKNTYSPNICVSYYICVRVRLLTPIFLSSYYYMCPHTPTYVSSYSYICVRVRLLTTIYVSSYYYMCPHTAICVSSYYICALIRLCMCPHDYYICVLITTIYVSS
jgi:hypothetical protein